MYVAIPLVLAILYIEIYENDVLPTTNYFNWFSPSNTLPNNLLRNGEERERFKKFSYWGKDLWYHQHWVRKLAVYPLGILQFFIFGLYFTRIGKHNVIKAFYNRSKDLVFIQTPGVFGKKITPVELHHFEKTSPSTFSSWKYMPLTRGVKEGYTIYENMANNHTFEHYYFRNEDKFWNHDVKKHFDDNTSTYWKGIRSRDVNEGLIFNNSAYRSLEEVKEYSEIKSEISEAVKKYGPLKTQDYENSFNYQGKLKLNNLKYNLIAH